MSENRVGNWIAVSRDMRDHPLVGFGRRPKAADPTIPACYSYAEGFLDLLMCARWDDGEVRNKGRKMLIRRGQLMVSHGSLAKRWNWTVKTVRGFLRTLSNDTMISTNSGVDREASRHDASNIEDKRGGNLCSVLTISNYDIYQPSPSRRGQPPRQASGTQRAGEGQAKGNNLILEQGNTDKGSEDSLCGSTAPAAQSSDRQAAEEQFEVFWKAFPAERKRGKGDCQDRFCAIVLGQNRKRRATAEQIIAAVRASCGIDPEKPPMPATWLNQGRWADDPHPKATRTNNEMSPSRQRELASRLLRERRDWPASYGPHPHQVGCRFTDPDVHRQLQATFDSHGRFIGDPTHAPAPVKLDPHVSHNAHNVDTRTEGRLH
jgi:hypothetical protein